ncbi:MerR family transcriptional regulator [Streptomyces griseorubiginosus]|uniref:MerR family transcriptional regulator n=1 Tax=Streptomyces griseorubiginosus TaxID=67304 RepID=UPI0033AF01AB
MWGWPVRTVDVAKESGYSVQQVRDLERLGVLPPAQRSANGYRSYTATHVHALRAYRGLADAMGPVEARRLLAELRTGTLTEAAAAVNEVHARLARERDETLRAQRALRTIRGEETARSGEAVGDEAAVRGDDHMTITQLAEALGVRSSTLRFWEDEGLVRPERVTTLRARRYGPEAIGAARVVVALRAGGYGIPAVREIMGALGDLDGLEDARRVLQVRLDRIAARSVALLRAGADLAAVVDAMPRTPGRPG